MLQGLIALQSVVQCAGCARLALWAVSNWCILGGCKVHLVCLRNGRGGVYRRVYNRRFFSLSPDCRTVEEQQVEEDVTVEEISLHSAAGSALW